MLSAVAASAGKMDTNGYHAEGYWLCEEDSSKYNINYVCPRRSLWYTQLPHMQHKNGCDEQVDELHEMIGHMRSATDLMAWLCRTFGFVGFVAAFSCCMCNMETALDLMSNSSDISGRDHRSRSIMGVASLCCASLCFLMVLSIMWLVMKPALGLCFFGAACCTCAGVGGLLRFSKRSGSDGADSSSFTRAGSTIGRPTLRQAALA